MTDLSQKEKRYNVIMATKRLNYYEIMIFQLNGYHMYWVGSNLTRNKYQYYLTHSIDRATSE